MRLNVSAPAGDRAAESPAPTLYPSRAAGVRAGRSPAGLPSGHRAAAAGAAAGAAGRHHRRAAAAATTKLERRHVPRAVGAPLVLLGTIAVVGGIVALLVPTFVHEGRQLVQSLPHTFDSLRNQLSRATHRPPSRAGHDVQNFVNRYANHPQKLLAPAATIGAGIAGFLTRLVVVLLTALFTAIHPRPLVDGAVRLVAPERRDHARHILRRLAVADVVGCAAWSSG